MLTKRQSVLAVQAAFCCIALIHGGAVMAADDKELADIRAQIQAMRESYEARLQALEKRLAEAQEKNAQLSQAASGQAGAAASGNAGQVREPEQSRAPAPAAPAGASMANLFNPAISLILVGTYANLSQDPVNYKLQGFIPSGGEVGPLKRGFGLGESEVTLASNIDPYFAGQVTFSLDGEQSVSVEEAFVNTLNLGQGLNAKFGRFYSGLGYQNSQHSHAWDFADVPLAYSALLGGQTTTNGLQLKWLAPTERFIELGAEIGNGASFPAGDKSHNGIGSALAFAHIGDDIGDNGSWRAGVSYLHSRAQERQYDDGVTNAFSGHSHTWIVDGVMKFTLPGNQKLKLQSEYLRRSESGSLAYDVNNPLATALTGPYQSRQSGWYAQAVYQFHPEWRIGARYDRLSAGSQNVGLINGGSLSAADFPILSPYHPSRTGLILDWNGSEFSRIRLQLARDKSRPGVADTQVYLQYIMSLGAHGAHSF